MLEDLKNRRRSLLNALMALEQYPWLQLDPDGDEVEIATGILVREYDKLAVEICYIEYADK